MVQVRDWRTYRVSNDLLPIQTNLYNVLSCLKKMCCVLRKFIMYLQYASWTCSTVISYNSVMFWSSKICVDVMTK